MEYRNDVPFIPKGLEVSQISFSGGRTAASLAPHGGLTHLNYYGAQRVHDAVLYRGDPISAWKQVFRLCVRIDDDLFCPEFNETRVFPFGYESECALAGVRLRHGMCLLNDALVYTATVLANPDGKAVALRVLHMGCSREDKATRAWRGFAMEGAANLAHEAVIDDIPPKEDDPSLAQAGMAVKPEPSHAETLVGVTATVGVRMTTSPRSFLKWTFTTEPFETRVGLCVFFGHEGGERFRERGRELRSGMFAEVDQRIAHYHGRLAAQPAIRMANPVVQSALRNVIPILDSMCVADIPGAVRAADSGYWVWGWDTLVHADAHGFGNDVAKLTDVLAFYRRTADPEVGIFHALTLNGRPMMAMAPAAQCLYAVTLYHAYCFGGDRTVLAEYFPFARKIVDRAGQDEVDGTGLLKGVSLYPDYPEDLEQDGDDISVFNNSIYFQALRVMAELAAELGDAEAAVAFTSRADRLLASFVRFFDEAKGCFVDSLSSRDFAPRRHYPSYAVLWATPFAGELVAPWRERIAAFMKEHLAARRGVRMLPKWDSRFMYDGNQLGAAMAVVENTYREMRHSVGDDGSAAELMDNMTHWWSRLCIPEGLTCEYENHGLTPDNPGRKQAFCAKAWLTMFYHVVVGLNLDCRGLSFVRGSGMELSVKGLAAGFHGRAGQILGFGLPLLDLPVVALSLVGLNFACLELLKSLDVTFHHFDHPVAPCHSSPEAISSDFRVASVELDSMSLFKAARCRFQRSDGHLYLFD